MLMKVSENQNAVFFGFQVISLPFPLSPTFSLSLSSSSSRLSFFRAPERHLSPHPAVNFDTCLMYASPFSHRTWLLMDGLSITLRPLLLRSSANHKWLGLIWHDVSRECSHECVSMHMHMYLRVTDCRLLLFSVRFWASVWSERGN